MYLPPDEDNFDRHGYTNLVIKYNTFSSQLKLNKEIHKDSPFFKRKMLDGVLDKVLLEANEHLEPIRDEILNMDRLSFYFLVVGSMGTLVVGMLMATLVSIYALVGLVTLFITTLACTYFRNYRQ